MVNPACGARSRRFLGDYMRNALTNLAVAALASIGLMLAGPAAHAQMTSVDPNTAIDSDLNNPAPPPPPPPDTIDPLVMPSPADLSGRGRIKGILTKEV